MKLLSILLIALLLIQVVVEAKSALNDPTRSLSHEDAAAKGNSESLIEKRDTPKINCGSECARRCSKSSRPNYCRRACNSCCKKCHCVPPGTSGNKNLCPCYASQTTHGNRPKCP